MPEIVLSRRNLLALLSKLDEPGSAATIIKPDGTVVQAAEDEAVYVDRVTGQMHPNTELALENARLRADARDVCAPRLERQATEIQRLRLALDFIRVLPCPTPCPLCPDCARDLASVVRLATDALKPPDAAS